jgi:hypothetical protein
VETLRTKGRWVNVELNERDKDTDKQERRQRIKESRYNSEHERCMAEENPEYQGRERTDIGWEERELSTCRMDVAK